MRNLVRKTSSLMSTSANTPLIIINNQSQRKIKHVWCCVIPQKDDLKALTVRLTLNSISEYGLQVFLTPAVRWSPPPLPWLSCSLTGDSEWASAKTTKETRCQDSSHPTEAVSVTPLPRKSSWKPLSWDVCFKAVMPVKNKQTCLWLYFFYLLTEYSFISSVKAHLW